MCGGVASSGRVYGNLWPGTLASFHHYSPLFPVAGGIHGNGVDYIHRFRTPVPTQLHFLGGNGSCSTNIAVVITSWFRAMPFI